VDRKGEKKLLDWGMTRPTKKSYKNSEEVKTQLKRQVAERIDALFERLPEGSSVAEIEKALLKESPEVTSEVFQALVDRQDFFPSKRTPSKRRAAKEWAQEKQGQTFLG
jgi:hypothetical protein